ncbi:fasciclin domain-containing protein [Aquimarina sp. 2-A2]|uniref:fasciclin domain-containing protein n=1 Tax=Aquimarina sp. 2-A2 TaxID=3382644 RepID=UPI00387EF0D5
MKKLLTTITLSTLLFTLACANNTKQEETEKVETEVVKEDTTTPSQEKSTIVSVAASNDKFTTLVAAVKAADLVDTLNGDGPFTVFAPLNSAFDQLPEGTVDGLLKAENKDKLSQILTYHVVSGKISAADLIKAINDNNGSYMVNTVQGGQLTATIKDGSVILTDSKETTSKVVMTDVEASNGVIHAIDTVVMP